VSDLATSGMLLPVRSSADCCTMASAYAAIDRANPPRNYHRDAGCNASDLGRACGTSGGLSTMLLCVGDQAQSRVAAQFPMDDLFSSTDFEGIRAQARNLRRGIELGAMELRHPPLPDGLQGESYAVPQGRAVMGRLATREQNRGAVKMGKEPTPSFCTPPPPPLSLRRTARRPGGRGPAGRHAAASPAGRRRRTGARRAAGGCGGCFVDQVKRKPKPSR
jgi:hypothetical protein